jgi:hypothetical protein
MPAHYKKLQTVILAGLICVAGCQRSNAPWVVLANSLPSQVHTDQSFVSVVLYILKQTHEPLLRKDDGENYSSRILRKWTRSLDNRDFTFCPDESLRFSAQTEFSVQFLKECLTAIARKYDDSASLSIHDGCVDVRFARSHPGYMDYLTLYENAPTIKRNEFIEDGLGPFYIEKIDKNSIILARKTRITHGYNFVVLRQNTKDGAMNLGEIADRNLLSESENSGIEPGAYQSFYNTELRTGDLIINHPNPEMRRLIYNCTDIDMLRRSFLPATNTFIDVATVFPIGVPGAQRGFPKQDCQAALSKMPKKRDNIIFSNWRTDNNMQMRRFVDAFFKRTGVRIRLVHYPPDEFKKMLHNRPRPYHLTVMHLDAVVPDYKSFLETFFRKDGYLDFDLPAGAKYFKEMLRTEDSGRKHELAMYTAGELSKEAVALPLYQNVRRFQYPKKIRNIVVGQGFLVYPEVGDFKW